MPNIEPIAVPSSTKAVAPHCYSSAFHFFFWVVAVVVVHSFG